jgi:plastocyanin
VVDREEESMADESPVLTRDEVTVAHPDTHLRGWWLIAARVLWITVVALALVLLGIALPEFYRSARTISPPETQMAAQLTAEDVRLLQQWGVSLGAYAAFQMAQIAIFSLVFTAVAALIFWHKSVDRIALFVSLWFAVVGLTTTPLLEPLIRIHPMWLLPIRFLQGASLACFPILTYVFPDGRFVPRWTRALTQPDSAGTFAFAALFFAISLVMLVAYVGALVQNYRAPRSRPFVSPPAPAWGYPALLALAAVVSRAILSTAIQPRGTLPGVSPETLAALPGLTAKDYSFATPILTVKAGETVALRLDNADSSTHYLDIDELNVHAIMPAGKSNVALFAPTEPGRYTFYCHPHADKATGEGMVGTLIVE